MLLSWALGHHRGRICPTPGGRGKACLVTDPLWISCPLYTLWWINYILHGFWIASFSSLCCINAGRTPLSSLNPLSESFLLWYWICLQQPWSASPLVLRFHLLLTPNSIKISLPSPFPTASNKIEMFPGIGAQNRTTFPQTDDQFPNLIYSF